MVKDIKCHMTKMHRLLICYYGTAVVVFSLNKNRVIQSVMVNNSNKLGERGKALAVEWIGPECREFIVGFQRGQIEVYRAETNNAKPVRIIDFNPIHMKSLEMTVL